jgi:hypothetical protein
MVLDLALRHAELLAEQQGAARTSLQQVRRGAARRWRS